MTAYVEIEGLNLRRTGPQIWATQDHLDGSDWISKILPYMIIIKDENAQAAAADWCKRQASFYLVDFSDWRGDGAIYRFRDSTVAMIFKLTWVGS